MNPSIILNFMAMGPILANIWICLIVKKKVYLYLKETTKIKAQKGLGMVAHACNASSLGS